MLTQQPTSSIAVLKVNFMNEERKADRIAECQSKAYNRKNRDGSIGVVASIHDGVNLTVSFTDGPVEDVTNEIKGATANFRFTQEQWDNLNARFHTMEGVGAYIEVEVDGNVEHGTLTIDGEDVLSLTIYVSEVNAVEEVKISRITSTTARDDFFAGINKNKVKDAEKAEKARATNRAARASVEGQPAARKTAKI